MLITIPAGVTGRLMHIPVGHIAQLLDPVTYDGKTFPAEVVLVGGLRMSIEDPKVYLAVKIAVEKHHGGASSNISGRW